MNLDWPNGVGAMSTDSRIVRSVTEVSFAKDVVEQSSTVPVVLDLWADWCEPCKALSPIIERVALDYRGRIVLGKVDVDSQPAIAKAFQIQSIPSVFAVIAGQPIPLFQGALSESEVRAYFSKLLEVAAENGVTGRLPDPAGLIRPITLGTAGSASAPAASAPSGNETSIRGQSPPRIETSAASLFVSHASEDGREAADVTAELERRGVGAWLATRDIQVGENYAAQIYNAIVECSHLLVLLSPAAVASVHVQREVNLALDQGKAILPLVVTTDADFLSTLPAEWKYWLGVVQVVPYTGSANAVDLLLRGMGARA